MDNATLTQTIQTAKDIAEDYRPQSGSCCLCGRAGAEWSLAWQDYICMECVQKNHAEHKL